MNVIAALLRNKNLKARVPLVPETATKRPAEAKKTSKVTPKAKAASPKPKPKAKAKAKGKAAAKAKVATQPSKKIKPQKKPEKKSKPQPPPKTKQVGQCFEEVVGLFVLNFSIIF